MLPQKLVIGLTGGIGSGKSEVSRRFENLGISIIDADLIAREVVEPGSPALKAIAEHFGAGFLLPEGQLDRAKLRERIFTDAEAKIWLEQLLHPQINQLIRKRLVEAISSYAILSSPLLLETGQSQLVDRVLVVDTSENLQIERATQRDANKREQIEKIMQSQLSRADRCGQANDIIQNHGDISELDEQVYKLHQLYLELSKSSSTPSNV